MKPLPDVDLEFLNDVPNEGLKKIVDLLVYDPEDGKKRISESLSNTIIYNNCYPKKLNEMVNEIIHEFQCFGADSVVNLFRKHGVTYREILSDICKKKDVNIPSGCSITYMEFELLRKLVADSVHKSSDNYIDAVIEDLELKYKLDASIDEKKELILEALNDRKTRLKVYHYILSPGSTEISGATGRILKDAYLLGVGGVGMKAGILFGTKQFVGKSAAAFIPGAQLALIGWGLFDLLTLASGPAFRITVPCTIIISILREEMYMKEIQKIDCINSEESLNTEYKEPDGPTTYCEF